ncbi:MAG: hypothetical protein ABR503_12645 [Chitinophagaceae bacterium]
MVISLMQRANQTNLTLQLDNEEYDETDLISIKTPLNLPYYSNSPTYERAYGSIEIGGVEYEYVKRRVYNDSLELLCLPNKVHQKLQSAKVEFFKMSSDIPGSSQNKKNTSFKNVLPEFCEDLAPYSLRPVFKPGQEYFSFTAQILPSSFSLVEEQPPEHRQFVS